MDADKVVREFCEAWSRADLETIMDAFTDDAVYHNIPMAPCKGKDEIRTFIAGLLGGMASSVEFDVRLQLVDGLKVMNERIDTIVMGDKNIVLPVCGVFELTEDGKIAGWRDYFDAGQFAGN
ncbi:MAG: limonene-1,2-epoxide hydrolase [Deltaproteobacteria bacterium]|jgi:limonene-1,2-epoxide hydrolase|nr:limonene-1,2-epoxide hydrolase [Deltaproteobacteria bacterium]